MNLSLETADVFLASVTAQSREGVSALYPQLDRLDAPIYVTDAEGFVTYFNRACIGFTGRVPAVGKDRWCVTWKLFTSDGNYLPHDQCPMAIAIKQGKPVRGLSAIAARPDGSRVPFAPFPTPLYDADGQLCGAINILLDLTDPRQAAELRSQAAKCRRLARDMTDREARDVFRQMADEYEGRASELGG